MTYKCLHQNTLNTQILRKFICIYEISTKIASWYIYIYGDVNQFMSRFEITLILNWWLIR